MGDLKNPLLLSVRSGARVSMPGMMDTILNLGLNDKTVIALSKKTSNTLEIILHMRQDQFTITIKKKTKEFMEMRHLKISKSFPKKELK